MPKRNHKHIQHDFSNFEYMPGVIHPELFSEIPREQVDYKFFMHFDHAFIRIKIEGDEPPKKKRFFL